MPAGQEMDRVNATAHGGHTALKIFHHNDNSNDKQEAQLLQR